MTASFLLGPAVRKHEGPQSRHPRRRVTGEVLKLNAKTLWVRLDVGTPARVIQRHLDKDLVWIT